MNQPPEQLTELAEYPDYGCTPDGFVWSRKSGCWRRLKGSDGGHGYLKVNIYRGGGVENGRPHVLVALAFLGARPEGMDINHRNGIKTDNRVENLEYVTRQENVRHSIEVLGRGSVPPDEQTQRVRSRREHAMRMRRLAARLWLRDGRLSFSVPARLSQKLTDAGVREIRANAAGRSESRRKMAARFGVSKNTIDRIIAGQKWAHLL